MMFLEQTGKLSETPRKLPPSIRDLNAKYTVPLMGNKNSINHSNRSFKPQLEDIKSSYYLLNKTKDTNIKKALENGNKNLSSIPKPKPVGETQRMQQLSDVKKKFQSKQFWNETKYDKIEGLNWISWK